jgi:hypothetical protein
VFFASGWARATFFFVLISTIDRCRHPRATELKSPLQVAAVRLRISLCQDPWPAAKQTNQSLNQQALRSTEQTGASFDQQSTNLVVSRRVASFISTPFSPTLTRALAPVYHTLRLSLCTLHIRVVFSVILNSGRCTQRHMHIIFDVTGELLITFFFDFCLSCPMHALMPFP